MADADVRIQEAQRQALQRKLDESQAQQEAPQRAPLLPADLEAQNAAVDSINRMSDVTPTPLAPPAPAVQVPFASQEDQRAFEMEQAQQRQAEAELLFQQQQEQALAARDQETAMNAELQERDRLSKESGAARAQAAAMAEEEDRLEALNRQISSSMDEQEEAAKGTLSNIFAGDSVGKKIGAAMAILVGGISQGLTGRAANPVMKFLEQADAQLLASKKIKTGKLNAARAQILSRLEADLRKKKSQLTDAKAIADLDKTIAETQKIKNDIRKSMAISEGAKVGAKIVDPNTLNEDQRKRAVRAPDGSFRLTVNEDQAKAVNKFMGETGAVVGDLQDLVNFTKDKRFYNPVGADKARVQTKIATLVGALRLPITGPGPLTDAEREFLVQTIGDPSKFFSLKSVELSRLNEIQNNINRRVANAYKQGGIDLEPAAPVNQQDRLTQQGLDPERIEKIKTFLRTKQQK